MSFPEADAIVVLGCRVRPDGTPGAFLQARIEAGVAALEARRAPLLLLSGGRRWGNTSESQAMRRVAIDLGALPETIALEDISQTTADNAIECCRLLGRGQRVAIVTQAFHARRALQLFHRAGLLPTWLPATTPRLPPWTRARLLTSERIALALDWLFR